VSAGGGGGGYDRWAGEVYDMIVTNTIAQDCRISAWHIHRA
jgi:hypothetical protein